MNTSGIKKILPLLILIGAMVIAVLMVTARPEPATHSKDIAPSQVNVINVLKNDVPVSIVAHGNVFAWRELELVSEVTGRVIWVSPDFEPGKAVNENSPLLRIDKTDYQLALAEAKAALASSELALADARALKRKASIKEAEASVSAAQQRIIKAQKDLENTELRAPYNAVIDTQLVELGQYITAGKSVARILGSDKAEVRLPVIAADVGFLEEGSKSDISLYAQIGQEEYRWLGKLTAIESRVDEQTRVFPVVVTVENPLDLNQHGRALPFGMFVRAEIPGDVVSNAVRLPGSVVHSGNLVYRVVEGLLRKTPVKVIRTDSLGVVISDGLNNGDKVVSSRLELMFDGMPVVIAND